LLKDLIKAPNASKARRQGNLSHWQSGVLNQLLGEKYSPGLGNRDRGSTKMLPEQASKLALADTQPCR
jgi:hypothetical protein